MTHGRNCPGRVPSGTAWKGTPVGSPASVVAYYLTIIANDLGCDPQNIVVFDERCVRILWVPTFLTTDKRTGRACLKAISTLLAYAVLLEQRGQQGVINAILRAARVSGFNFSNHGKFAWGHVVVYLQAI